MIQSWPQREVRPAIGLRVSTVWRKPQERPVLALSIENPNALRGHIFSVKMGQDRQTVKKVKITINGRIIHMAHRTFEIEVADDENVQLYDTNTVSDLADDARAIWQINEQGEVYADEHTIDGVTDAGEISPATLDTTDPRIARICSIFGIDPNHDSRLGDEPPVSF